MESYSETIERVKPVAEAFVKNFDIKYPITQSMHTADQLGYYIIKAKAPQNLSGFYMKKDRFPFIFVNASHSLGRQNFSLWHEVYHHQMNHLNGISDFNSESVEEREAEIFAGCVLLPDKELEKRISGEVTQDTVAFLSHTYQMSFTAVAVRLMQEQYISYENYKELKKLSNIEEIETLHSIYRKQNLSTDVLHSTESVKISPNILELLQKNYQSQKLSKSTLNEMIKRIEGLNHD